MRKTLPGWLLLLALCTSPGCAAYGRFLDDQSDARTIAGTIESAGGPTGAWTFEVEDCDSGMREGFYGVTLFSKDRRRAVRVVRNPVGPMTIAVGAGDEFVEVPCRAVVGAVNRTGTRINNIPVLTGEIRFSCSGLRGSATFTCS